MRTVLNDFDDEESDAMFSAKELFENPNIPSDLAFIKVHFSLIIQSIEKLQTQNLPLNKSMESVEKVRERLEEMNDKTFVEKFDKVFKRNVGFDTIRAIRDILEKNYSFAENEYTRNLLPIELAKFKCCPTTSCDVERSFSVYKEILSAKRQGFLFENVRKHLILKCNQNNDEEENE